MAFAPRLPSTTLPRPRLDARLDSDPPHRVVVVRAPAGGGKTTLVADWATRRGRDGVWVTLDHSDARRLAFWNRVVAALVASGRIPAGSVLHDLVPSPEMADGLRAALLSGLAALPEPLLLVLDDLHRVEDDAVHDDLRWLVEAGARVDLVLLTRAVTPFERSDWRARCDVHLLRPADLAFDAEETRAAAHAVGLDAEGAAALHAEFGGWPLAVKTTVVELASHPGIDLETAVARVRTMSTTELLADAEGTPYLEFLLRLAVARRATPELARELGGGTGLGGAESALLLRRAENDGLGGWTRDGTDAEFALQPYLRSHLLAELERRMPAEAARLHATVGRHLAARGQAAAAIREFVAAGDWESVSNVIRTAYGDILLHHGPEVAGLLTAADPAELRRHPLLLVFKLSFDSAGGGVPRGALLHNASLGIALLQARLGTGSRDRVPLLYALMGAQRLGGHFDAAHDTAERLVATLGALDEEGQRAVAGIRSRAWLHAATSSFFAEQSLAAAGRFRTARELARTDGHPWTELHAAGMELLMTAMRGDHAALAPELESARARTAPHGWRGTYSAAGFHLAEAYLALESFDTVSARAQLDELAAHEATIEHWPLIARLRGLAAIVDGAGHSGAERLAADIAAHAHRVPTSGSMETLLAATRADLLLIAGEPHRAAEAVRSVRTAPTAALAQARVNLALGRPDRAIAHASGVPWAQAPLPRPKAEALLVTAVAAARLGRHEDARVAAIRALELLTAAGLRRPLLSVPRGELSAVLALTDAGADAVLLGVPDVMPASDATKALTATELQVLHRLHTTSGVEQTAAALYLSINTVKSHLRSIYRKLGVRTRHQALAVAVLRGLLKPSGDQD